MLGFEIIIYSIYDLETGETLRSCVYRGLDSYETRIIKYHVQNMYNIIADRLATTVSHIYALKRISYTIYYNIQQRMTDGLTQLQATADVASENQIEDL